MSGLKNMKARVGYTGYDSSDGRIVNNKYKSFQSALKSSYQAEWITLDRGTEKERRYRCLINPSRLTENFDKKVISIDFDSGVKEGTVFWWDRTNKYWMIDLQQHTEEAYFRGIITRADYVIEIDGEEYRAIARGPIETTIDWQQKHQITWNDLNYSLVLKIAKNSKTMKYFTRHKIVKVKMDYYDEETDERIEEYHNWKVAATDKYSSDFLIDLYLDEYYDNSMEDAQIPVEGEEPDEMKPHIDGLPLVYGFDTDLVYSIVGIPDSEGIWSVDNKKIAKILSCNNNECTIEILTGKPNEFVLKYESTNNDIILEQKIKIQSF